MTDVLRDQGKEPAERERLPRAKHRGGKKPWRVEYQLPPGRWPSWAGRGWSSHGRYRRGRDARQAYVTQVRKGSDVDRDRRWGYRLIGPDGAVVESYVPWREADDGRLE